MSREVTYLRLQTRAYVKGVGDLGDVFPPEGKTLEGLFMEAAPDSQWIEVSFLFRGERYECLVPWTNVIVARQTRKESPKAALKVAK